MMIQLQKTIFQSPLTKSEKLKNAYRNSLRLSFEQENSTQANTPDHSQWDERQSDKSSALTNSFSSNQKLDKNRKFSDCQEFHYHNQPYFEIEVKPQRKDFANIEEKQQFIEEYTKQLKTELCQNWILKGTCQFGENCSFAHGQEELKGKIHLHENYQTKACKKYFYRGLCNYGNRCQYLHYELAYQNQFKDFASKLFQEKQVKLPCADYPKETSKKEFNIEELELQRFRTLFESFYQREAFRSMMPKQTPNRLSVFDDITKDSDSLIAENNDDFEHLMLQSFNSLSELEESNSSFEFPPKNDSVESQKQQEIKAHDDIEQDLELFCLFKPAPVA